MDKFRVDDAILWIDDDLLVVNKPAGLLTLPHGYDPTQPYLLNLLKERFPNLWVVHRLDRDTSGVILFARTSDAHRHLNIQFEQRQVSKSYHAIVQGAPAWQTKLVKMPLRPNGDRKHRTVVDHRGGKASATELSVMDRFGGYTRIEAKPKSGRRHQIRAHLAALGLPIVGDPLYGDGDAIWLSKIKENYQTNERQERPLLNRLGLHARAILFRHPRNDDELTYEAPYPKDFTRAIKALSNYHPRS